MEQLVTIEIFGQKHTFRANSDKKQAKEVESFLQDEIKKIETEFYHKQPKISKEAILILLALNISNEHVKLKNKYTDILQSTSKWSISISNKLNDILEKNEI